jgi:hypothetical protein
LAVPSTAGRSSLCHPRRSSPGEPDVGVAEQSFRVADFRDAGQPALEFGDRGGVFAVHGDVCEAFEAKADGGGVDDGPVAADRSGAFEFTEPAVAGGDAERDALGKLGDGKAAVRLKLSKNFAVNHVHNKYNCTTTAITA